VRAEVHGILLLDKPFGLSSAAAVGRVKWLFGARKAGHTGSLDPLATGMLPVCFGEATKFGAQLLEADKTYRVSVRLGERTPSADRETEVVETRPVPAFARAELNAALAAFPRDYTQIPPMHSALKQDGKPLYEYARAGIMRERAARSVTLHELTLLDWQVPELSFDVRCTKGAYIRVLAIDLAAHLGTIGFMSSLHRLGVAPFAREALWSLEQLEALSPTERVQALLPVDAALCECRRLEVPLHDVGALRQGRTLTLEPGADAAAEPYTVRMYADGLGFLGLGEMDAGGRLVPLRLIAAPSNRA
jgi:tRNA pseudouridine55 synthase